jgi:tetratricopeptide (TPR) repeat protein/transcriptional regulator with XRE-family HTH domain
MAGTVPRAGRTPDGAATCGQLLQRYRRLAGLTQEELAERGGYSPNYISKLERDQRQPPLLALERLATALGLADEEREALRAACPEQGRRQTPPRGTPLAGRVRELAQIRRHLGGLEPPALLLAGEPGIGKSRLLAEAAAHAATGGWRVVQGGCQRRAQDPYAPLPDALARSLRQLPGPARAAAQEVGWLGLLLPELAAGAGGSATPVGVAPGGGGALPPEQQRRLLFASVAHYLRGLAGPAGTLLVLDDLQWAGADALDLLAALVTAAEPPPIRLIAAYRDSEAPAASSLGGLIADLARASLVRVLPLGPLSAAEAEQLLADLLPDADEGQRALLPAITRRAGGVPLFLLSYIEELRLRGDGAARSLELPWTVAQVIRQRVVALPASVQELLGMAAVIGRLVSRPLLTRVSGVAEEEVLAAMEAAAAARLLEEEGETGYRFAHDVIQETVEQGLSAGRRQLLHRRIGEALERDEAAPVEALAYHHARGGDEGKAIRYLEAAGQAARAEYAHAAAAGYYRELGERLERLGRIPAAARARESLGSLLRTMAHFDAAVAELEQAVDGYWRAADPDGVCRSMAMIGRLYAVTGRQDEGVRRLRQLLESVEAGGSRPASLAAIYAALARLYELSGRHGDEVTTAERAITLARQAGDDRLLAEVSELRGWALLQLGRSEEAQRVLTEAIPLAEASGELEALAWSHSDLLFLQTLRGDFATARLHGARGFEVATRRGDPAQIVWMAQIRAFPAIHTGEWALARQGFEQAVALAGREHSSHGSAYASMWLGWLCLVEGRWDEACAHLEESTHITEGNHDVPALRLAQSLLAELDVLEGRPERARARLLPLLDAPDQQDLYVTFPLLPTLAWAELEAGDVAAAAELAGQAIDRARQQTFRLALVHALWVQMLVLTRQGRWQEATRALEEGLALTRGMGHPYYEGRLLQAGGQLHRRTGEPEAAREHLAMALAIFRRLGAHEDSERTERLLATLG